MKTMFRDRPTVSLTIVLLTLVALEAFLVPHHSPRFFWHHVPGYGAVIGLGACIVVVLVSKALGSWILQRPEPDE
ncbi:MAG: hypothetical protein ACOC5I_01510 [Gemmatimonadota bacterium]